MFSVVAMKSRTFFPDSHVQLMSKCSGAGRKHSRTASPSWSMEIFHTLDLMLSLWRGDGQGAGRYLPLWFLWVLIFSCPGVWTCLQKFALFWEFCEIHKICYFSISRSLLGNCL